MPGSVDRVSRRIGWCGVAAEFFLHAKVAGSRPLDRRVAVAARKEHEGPFAARDNLVDMGLDQDFVPV